MTGLSHGKALERINSFQKCRHDGCDRQRLVMHDGTAIPRVRVCPSCANAIDEGNSLFAGLVAFCESCDCAVRTRQ